MSILRRPGLGGNDGTPTRRLPYFTARTAPEALARQLTTQLALKFATRAATVANLGELRALPTRALDDRGAVAPDCFYVSELSKSYFWKRFEPAADDGADVIRPDDVAASALGRFVAAPFRDFERRFYARHVQHVHTSLKRKELQELSGGTFPALFISYVSKQPQELVQNRGALQWDDFSFRVRAISANWRGEPGAALGSDVAEEATYDEARAVSEDIDPGATNIIADVEQWLRQNVKLNDPRIGRVIVGASRSLEQWGNDRLQMDELSLTIHVCTWVPNIPQDLVRLDLIKVQLQDVTEDDAGAVTLTDIGDQMQVNPDRAHAEDANA